MFRYLRIAILLTILAVVAGQQFLTENRFSSWKKQLWVTIYPVLVTADGDVQRYAGRLTPDSFQQIGDFIGKQARRYGRRLDIPVVIQVAKPSTSLPPALPAESSGLGVALWSLKMRWWVWNNSGQDGLAPDDIRMYVLYQKRKPRGFMERSVGVQNGGYGVVNAVASRQMAARNRIIITHELLHILGASDKYDLISGQPSMPEGLASPGLSPLFPQSKAEIMAGRIATSRNEWRNVASLNSCVIGIETAAEIGWR
jgi:hypothetical protein